MAYSTPIPPKKFQVQNWIVAPVVKPHGTSTLMVLTGVVEVDLQGNSPADWRGETILIRPDFLSPMQYALEHFSVHKFPGDEAIAGTLEFAVDQGAPFAAVSSVVDRQGRAGFAVDQWRLSQVSAPFFSGIEVDVAVLDDQAELYRISYHITLVGEITTQPFINKLL